MLLDFSKVDKHAPRFSKSVANLYHPGKNFADRRNKETNYGKLCEMYPNLAKYTEKQIFNILRRFNIRLCDYICTHRDGIVLPAQMGIIFVGTYERKKDDKTGKRESEGYGGWAFYTSELVKKIFKNSNYWSFDPCDDLRRRIAAAYKANWKMFVVVPWARMVKDMVKIDKRRVAKLKTEEEMLTIYNEFDI